MGHKRSRARVEALLQGHLPLIRSEAYARFPAFCRDPDLLQCGLIGLWEAAERWDGRVPFDVFARKCIYHNMLDHVRMLRRWGPTLEYRPAKDTREAGPDPAAETLELLERIRGVWPPNSRERYVLTALATGVSKTALALSLGMDTYRLTQTARRAWRSVERSDGGGN